MKKTFSAFTAISILSASMPVSAFNLDKVRFPVKKTVLPNGLTVLLHEDHTVSTISYQTWFRVGSKNEEPGSTGIAHLFEHLMFRGAKRYTGSDYDKILQANGATNNASTALDYTNYFIDLPSGKLKLAVDMESDRLRSLQLTPQNVKSEISVVQEERRYRVENSLPGLLNELLWSTAFTVHPYRWPTIGWMKDIQSLSFEKCAVFFHKYYSATNAVIAVAGDFEPGEALSLINSYYGDLPRVEIPPAREFPQEPLQKEERVATKRRPSQSDWLAVGYHVSKAGDDDSYVLDLLTNILAEGNSSRLYRRLVYKEQVASAVSGMSYTPQQPGLLEFAINLRPGKSYQAALRGLLGEIAKIREVRVLQTELDKAKNQTMAQWVNSMKTMHGRASSLAINEVVLGNYENLFSDLERYQKVTRDDIRSVARKYLQPLMRTTVSITAQKDSHDD